jgi:hypothetical protein
MHAAILAHLILLLLVKIHFYTTSCLYSPNILLGTPSSHSAPQVFSPDEGPRVTAIRNQQGVMRMIILGFGTV